MASTTGDTTTAPAPLHVPDEAVDALLAFDPEVVGDYDLAASAADVAREIAAPIVASELRRQAKGFDSFAAVGEKAPNQAGARMLRLAAERLRARADELDAS